MRIKRIKINNFRAISEMKLNLDPRLNIFVSKNGAGKTSVIDALSRSVYYAKDVKHPDHTGQREVEDGVIAPEDVTTGRSRALINVNYMIKNSSAYATISSDKSLIATNIKTLLDDFNYLPFKHYPVSREAFHCRYNPPANVLSEISTSARPVLDFLHSATYYNNFYDWLIERENNEYQQIRSFWAQHRQADVSASCKDNQLDIVISAIKNCTGFKNIFAHGKNGKIEVTKSTFKGDVTLTTDQLSRGEINYLCFIGDLAVQQMRAFPNMDNPLEGEGVYVIDELEKHMHPEQQRLILNKLWQNFPNCQFIITTHSPLIISSVKKPEQVFVLEEKAEGISYKHPDETFGLPESTIIEEVMGDDSRAEELKEKFTELYANIARRNLSKAKLIAEEISKVTPLDHELVQAKQLLAELEQKIS